MDNLIISVPSPISPVPDSDKALTGLIENLPPQLQNLKLGDSLLLDVLQISSFSNNGLKVIANVIDNRGAKSGVEVPIKMALPQINTDNISLQQVESFNIKITSLQPNQATFKVVNINSENPEKFFRCSVDNSSNITLDSPPVISKYSEMPKMAPLLLKNISSTANNLQINLELNQINVPKADFEYIQQIQETTVSAIKDNIVQEQNNPQKTDIPKDYRVLQTKQIVGIIKNERGITYIDTDLGRIFPENQDIKLPIDSRVLLIIKDADIITPKLNLSELLTDNNVYSKEINVANKIYDIPLLQKILAPLRDTSKMQEIGDKGREVINNLQELISSQDNRNLQSWRIIEIPFFNGETFSKIRVSTRRKEPEENDTDTPQQNGTRFVVDTSFSKLGDFQFDGFSNADSRKFDLIIRTSRPISDDLYSNIMRLYRTSLSQVDYHGNINIKENFIKICDDNASEQILNNGVYI